MPVPYLENPPAVVPIDVGRQLFVDDFLVEESTLSRTFHQPEYHKEPVITPEEDTAGMYAGRQTLQDVVYPRGTPCHLLRHQ